MALAVALAVGVAACGSDSATEPVERQLADDGYTEIAIEAVGDGAAAVRISARLGAGDVDLAQYAQHAADVVWDLYPRYVDAVTVHLDGYTARFPRGQLEATFGPRDDELDVRSTEDGGTDVPWPIIALSAAAAVTALVAWRRTGRAASKVRVEPLLSDVVGDARRYSVRTGLAPADGGPVDPVDPADDDEMDVDDVLAIAAILSAARIGRWWISGEWAEHLRSGAVVGGRQVDLLLEAASHPALAAELESTGFTPMPIDHPAITLFVDRQGRAVVAHEVEIDLRGDARRPGFGPVVAEHDGTEELVRAGIALPLWGAARTDAPSFGPASG